MRLTSLPGVAGALLFLGCQAGGSGTPVLDTNDQKASYAVGFNMWESLAAAGDHLDVQAMAAGIEDARAERDPRIAEAEIQTVMDEFNRTLQAERESTRETESVENREAGDAFLAQNGAREGVVTTGSGLQYEVLRAGDGPRPTADDRVTIHYRGSLVDGTEFDSSYGGEPATFAVGGVIPGFTEALQLMPVGSHYRIVIPGDIAYGVQGRAPSIGPDATLVFEIELLEIGE